MAEANRTDDGQILDADPKLLQPDLVELQLFQDKHEIVLVEIPEVALDLRPYSACEKAVGQIADTTPRSTSNGRLGEINVVERTGTSRRGEYGSRD